LFLRCPWDRIKAKKNQIACSGFSIIKIVCPVEIGRRVNCKWRGRLNSEAIIKCTFQITQYMFNYCRMNRDWSMHELRHTNYSKKIISCCSHILQCTHYATKETRIIHFITMNNACLVTIGVLVVLAPCIFTLSKIKEMHLDWINNKLWFFLKLTVAPLPFWKKKVLIKIVSNLSIELVCLLLC
jgi:hypothetical protein